MKQREELPPAIFVMGPTASGKSALAIELAEKLDTEIISVDSTLVYKGMDIGTAKPSLQERISVPHYLIDILDPAESFSTGSFRNLTLQLMQDITNRGKIPILVGGTMLYFNALFNGLANLPKADKEIRKKLDDDLTRLGKNALHQRLTIVDPESALRIHPNDPQRVQRALEVFELSGIPLSRIIQESSQTAIPYKKIKLIVTPSDRQILHQKIALRFKHMIDSGLVEEIKTLYQRGDLNERMPAIRAVGYRQGWLFLQGKYDFDVMIEKGIIATRQLAKRQYTWLRRIDDASHFVSYEKGLTNDVLRIIEHEV